MSQESMPDGAAQRAGEQIAMSNRLSTVVARTPLWTLLAFVVLCAYWLSRCLMQAGPLSTFAVWGFWMWFEIVFYGAAVAVFFLLAIVKLRDRRR
jgi:hypothetical protein